MYNPHGFGICQDPELVLINVTPVSTNRGRIHSLSDLSIISLI
jgi:hypothetical protein